MVGYLGLFANCRTYYDDCFPFVFDEKIWKNFSAGTNSYGVASFYLFGVFVLFSVE